MYYRQQGLFIILMSNKASWLVIFSTLEQMKNPTAVCFLPSSGGVEENKQEKVAFFSQLQGRKIFWLYSFQLFTDL